mmetsp:Transcript_60768/g.170283  ORF Transcript_60768/g.170283 Transcript_60768/m.170283 type:complete len:330 (-) Transcript_60768:226-1215(-)
MAARTVLASVVAVLEAIQESCMFAPIRLLQLPLIVVVALPRLHLVRQPLPDDLGLRRGTCGRRWRLVCWAPQMRDERQHFQVDDDIADDGVACGLDRAILVAARRGIHPRHVRVLRAPICDAQVHANRHDVSERRQVLLVAPPCGLEGDLPAPLRQDGAHAGESALQVLRKLGPHGERPAGVDHVVDAGAVGLLPEARLLGDAASVARGIVPIHRLDATVGGGLEGVAVRLHDVDLRAPLTADLVRITIVRRLVVLAGAANVRARLVLGRSADQVEGDVAPATHSAKIHVEADRPSQELEPGDALRGERLVAPVKQAQAAFVGHRDQWA